MTYACGRTFEKAVDDRAAAQGAALLFGLPVQFDIPVGKIEELVDVVGRQALDPEQMAVREQGLGGASLHAARTIGGTRALRNKDSGFVGKIARVATQPRRGGDPCTRQRSFRATSRPASPADTRGRDRLRSGC